MNKRTRTVLLTTAAILAGVMFALWAWYGTFTSMYRGILASGSVKLFLLALIMLTVGLLYGISKDRRIDSKRYRYYNEKITKPSEDASEQDKADYRNYRGKQLGYVVAVVGGVGIVASILITPAFGGLHRGTVVAESVTIVEEPQQDYKWRTPWTVAANSVSSRAGNVTGDFINASTTYMPATQEFVTPVQGRGFATGMISAVSQRGQATATVCEFTTEVPITNGWFSMNLKRALAFVDPNIFYSTGDEWVYCEDNKAVLVVPVMRMVGQPESTPVPAGVVLWDGKNVTLKENVKKGELPGPVYPSSLAAAQRNSLTAASGLMDKLFNRAGYETSENAAGDPNSGNASEILLERENGGWDYLTPLTPRGKSFTVTALAVVPADEVTAGKLNPMTIHTLPTPREGNQAIADRIKAMFPSLGWAAGLSIVEVVPTSTSTWEATLSNGRAVANRVTIDESGTMCLLTPTGVEVNCLAANGVPSDATDTNESTDTSPNPNIPIGSELSGLSDAELAELALQIAQEQLNRANQ